MTDNLIPKGKEYVFIDEKPMTYEQIQEKYLGYWVYVVKVRYNDDREFLDGIPVILATIPFGGSDDEIYTKYDTKEYDIRRGIELRNTGNRLGILTNMAALF